MGTKSRDDIPPLASLVQAGEEQREAERINDFIYMAKDISNLYLVKTDNGDVLINAGFMGSAARNGATFAAARDGPLHAILLTQAHPDHFGGVPELCEENTVIVAQQSFTDTAGFLARLMPYLARRSGKLWAGTVKRGSDPIPDIQPDITFDEILPLDFGGRRFEMISTPGGEAPDASVVWLANDKVLFTGNLFGPVFMAVPNLNTIRGDKPRSVNRFLASLDKVRNLGAELLITGHGEPIGGAARIRADLDKLHDAVAFIRDATIEGMNAGKDIYTLMAEIRLPDALSLGEFHGKVSWAVKSIWHEFSGWFMYDSTTSLYAVPRSGIDADLLELAGGADVLSSRAQEKIDAGKPLEALHLLDIVLHIEPAHEASLIVKRKALQRLLQESGGINLSEVMWLKSEIAAVDSVQT